MTIKEKEEIKVDIYHAITINKKPMSFTEITNIFPNIKPQIINAILYQMKKENTIISFKGRYFNTFFTDSHFKAWYYKNIKRM